jgi:hypothetical protein
MTQKHTPGPWTDQTDDGSQWGIYDRHGRCVAQAQQVAPLANDYTQEERTANARLISAAPDLLEALEGLLDSDLVKWFIPWPPEGIVETGAPPWSEELKQRAAPILAARAAIAKARGV